MKHIISYKQNIVSDKNYILSDTDELYLQQNANNHRVLGQEIVPLYEGSHRILFPQVEPKIHHWPLILILLEYFEIFVVPGPPQIFWSSLLLADTVVLQPEDAQLPENKEI